MQYFTAADGARLAFRDTGAGPALICLAGLTRNSTDFDDLAPHLRARLIRPDYRGRGASEWTGPATYTVAQEAQDVLALMDHLGLEATPVLGTSRGGLIGMALAAMAPERLTGVCLNDIGPEIAPEGLARIADYVGRPPRIATLGDAAAALAQSPGFETVPMVRWHAVALRLFRVTETGLTLPYDPALREAFLSAFESPQMDLWPLFDALAGKPVALLRGANSDLLTPDTVQEMRRRRPDMLYAEIPGRGHVPFLDEPESLRILRAFLEQTA
ncbi:pimeloyl-ACP methyl ester carboxylesterase [Rhodovulum imhoffii]|uniref:Pimeloyl-ACP methyl ester carboxylesterase n=2 Tax=Rhodovulum imhoffii TaxID=365340 RepID=A0A2T5BRA5_9RHOB|nr:pimeloyl-ACP methyl ester carboxylesterase [Rhodovulum imhoffii]